MSIYKFVSKGKYKKGASSNYDLLTGEVLLYFNDDGTGKWINLKNLE